jgi:LmbE family N-acetylglucosaminyl deacetylase
MHQYVRRAFTELWGTPSGLATLRERRYAEGFAYDRASDYRYVFPRGTGTEVEVDGSFAWPAGEVSGAAFLELEIATDRLGKSVDPSLVMRAKNERAVQYVERGARGRRYFNLSSLAPALPSEVAIEGRHLSVPRQRAILWRLPEVAVATPLLVIGPHPDDCEIAAFGLYRDRDAWTVTISAGEIGTHDAGGLFPPTPEGAFLRGKTRVSESITAPSVGGIPMDRAMNLGYFDGSIEALYRGFDAESAAGVDVGDFRAGAAPPAPEVPTWRTLVADLRTLFERIRPRTIAAPHPVLEHHPDHRYAGLAVLEALSRTSLEGNVFFYAVHTPGAGLTCVHPVGPRDGVVSLPPLATDDALFDTLHSEPLDETTVRRKILALDTYRDIRTARAEPPSRLGEVAYEAARSVYRSLVVYDSSFVRKAARPNELFYVVPFERARDYDARFRAKLARL